MDANLKSQCLKPSGKMRASEKRLYPFKMTTQDYYHSLCSQPHHGIISDFNTIFDDLSPPSQAWSTDQSFDIPPYNIETWDFKGNEGPVTLSENVFSHFKAPDALPLLFATCQNETPDGNCPIGHAISLVGSRKVPH